MRYIVGRYYKAGAVEYQAGQVIEIDDPEYAAWLARDMRGGLEPVVQAPPAPPIDAPVVVEPDQPQPAPLKRKTSKRG